MTLLFKTSGVMLALVMLTPLVGRAREKQPFTASGGDLMFTATQVETTQSVPSLARVGPTTAQRGFHFVVVDVEVRNVGRRAECASLTADLQASLGVTARRIILVGGKAPEINQLLPGEKAEGSYTFVVKDGISPLKLILSPTFGLQGCGGGGLDFRSVTINLSPSSPGQQQ